MKILSVVGARPQFIKLAPVHLAAQKFGIEHIVVHTGQHYDPSMSQLIFSDLGLPNPKYNLEIGSGSHAFQTGNMMIGLEPIISAENPDWVLVYGDTNSTIAAALSAVKIHTKVAHLEAGLRSSNRAMPEEHNRIATDHLSDILFAPTEQAMIQLEKENLGEKSYLVGDVMVDACLTVKENAIHVSSKDKVSNYVICTIHRAENTNSKNRITEILQKLANINFEVRLVAHPRLMAKCDEFGIDLHNFGVHVLPPLSYSQMVKAVLGAVGVITDSGGLQKEAFLLETPCVTVRTETEWPETVSSGWNILDPEISSDVEAFFVHKRSAPDIAVYGDGLAAEKMISVLLENAI